MKNNMTKSERDNKWIDCINNGKDFLPKGILDKKELTSYER